MLYIAVLLLARTIQPAVLPADNPASITIGTIGQSGIRASDKMEHRPSDYACYPVCGDGYSNFWK